MTTIKAKKNRDFYSPAGVVAIAFDQENRVIISRADGEFFINVDDALEPLYARLFQ